MYKDDWNIGNKSGWSTVLFPVYISKVSVDNFKYVVLDSAWGKCTSFYLYSFSNEFFRLQVYPLHSSVTLEEQNNVFLAPVPGYRKVSF